MRVKQTKTHKEETEKCCFFLFFFKCPCVCACVVFLGGGVLLSRSSHHTNQRCLSSLHIKAELLALVCKPFLSAQNVHIRAAHADSAFAL